MVFGLLCMYLEFLNAWKSVQSCLFDFRTASVHVLSAFCFSISISAIMPFICLGGFFFHICLLCISFVVSLLIVNHLLSIKAIPNDYHPTTTMQ